MKNEDNITISISFHYQKKFKNGKQLSKQVQLDYSISSEIASKEDIKKLAMTTEIAKTIYESQRKLINVHNQERRNDVLYIMDNMDNLKDEIAMTSLIEKDVQTYHKMQLVFHALESLTDKQRRRFCLYFLIGYSYREIAEIENVSYDVIKTCIQKSVRKIKNICKCNV